MSDNETQVEQANERQNDELPTWARESLTKANKEAAAKRVENKELKAQLAEVSEQIAKYESQIKTLMDEKAELAAKVEAGSLELLKLRVTLAAGIPGEHAAEFAGRLKGSTEEELKADAEKIAELFKAASKTPAVDPSQGYGDGNSANQTPADLFAQSLRAMVGRK